MTAKKMHLFLFFTFLFNIFASFVHPVTPTFIVERKLDASMFGIALAAMNTMFFLLSPFWGRLCDYIASKKVFLICAVGYGIGQIFFLLARSEVAVVAARMFAGSFTGGCYTAFANQTVNTSVGGMKEKNRNLTLLETLHMVGSACGYFLGGLVGVISVEASCLCQILGLISCGILVYAFCADDTEFKYIPKDRLNIREVNPFSAFKTVRNFATPLFIMIFAIVAISSLGQNSYEQCFNYFIKDQFGMTSAYNGTFKAVIAIITLILNMTVCMYLQKKTDINKTFIYVLLACTTLILTILVFNGQILFVVIYILYSSVNAIRTPILQSMCANRATAETSNNVMGFYQSMNSLGGIFGALFAGLIYKANPMLPFILAFTAYAISLLIGFFYRRGYEAGKA
ncbi:MAG: MFS transporter [Lachnospiraceae bacterium]|nr:MFS transporter [Lachnospiraceae bacterium]